MQSAVSSTNAGDETLSSSHPLAVREKYDPGVV